MQYKEKPKPKTKNQIELQFVINLCDQNNDVSNRQLKLMISILALNIREQLNTRKKQTAEYKQDNNQPKQEQDDTRAIQLIDIVSNKINLFDEKIEKLAKISDQKLIQLQQSFEQIQGTLDKTCAEEITNHANQLINIKKQFVEKLEQVSFTVAINGRCFDALANKVAQLGKYFEVQQPVKKQQKKIQKLFNRNQDFSSYYNQYYSYYSDNYSNYWPYENQKKYQIKKDPQAQKALKKKNQKSMFEDWNKSTYIPAFQWIDYSLSKLKINFIENKIYPKQQSTIYGRKKLDQTSPSYTIEIEENRSHCISLGIVEKIQINQVVSIRQCNTFIYPNLNDFSQNQTIRGFKRGDRVTIKIDILEGKIIWKVREEIIYTRQSQILKDTKIEWFPVIHLYSSQDIICIIK